MDKLIDLFQAGTVTKEFKTSKLRFTLRTLTADEIIDVLRRADILSTSEETKVFIAKKLTVAYSLEAVNGVEVLALPEIVRLREKDKEKQTSKVDMLLAVLGDFEADVINDLFYCYNSLVTESNKKREELKKVSVAQ